MTPWGSGPIRFPTLAFYQWSAGQGLVQVREELGIEEPQLIVKEDTMDQAEAALLACLVLFRGCRRDGRSLALSKASWKMSGCECPKAVRDIKTAGQTGQWGPQGLKEAARPCPAVVQA